MTNSLNFQSLRGGTTKQSRLIWHFCNSLIKHMIIMACLWPDYQHLFYEKRVISLKAPWQFSRESWRKNAPHMNFVCKHANPNSSQDHLPLLPAEVQSFKFDLVKSHERVIASASEAISFLQVPENTRLLRRPAKADFSQWQEQDFLRSHQISKNTQDRRSL